MILFKYHVECFTNHVLSSKSFESLSIGILSVGISFILDKNEKTNNYIKMKIH